MRMAAHLDACDDCRRLLKAYRSVDRQIGELPDMAPSPAFARDFDERLRAMVGQPTAMERLKGLLSRGLLSRGLRLGWRPVWAAGVAACLVAGLFFYHQEGEVALSVEEIVIVENLDLFRDFELLQKLELLENWDRGQEGRTRS